MEWSGVVRGGVLVASPGVGSRKFWTYGAPLGLALHARCFGSSSKLLRERERGRGKGGTKQAKIHFHTHDCRLEDKRNAPKSTPA